MFHAVYGCCFHGEVGGFVKFMVPVWVTVGILNPPGNHFILDKWMTYGTSNSSKQILKFMHSSNKLNITSEYHLGPGLFGPTLDLSRSILITHIRFISQFSPGVLQLVLQYGI